MTGQKLGFVAEKKKLGMAIATQLEKRSPIVERGSNWVRGNDWGVAWTRGHMFELEDLDFYLKKAFPEAKTTQAGKLVWDRSHLLYALPYHEYSMRVSLPEFLPGIRKIVSGADVIVHAGDPDREGQLVVDEILEHLKIKKPVKRVEIHGMDEKSVRDGLVALRDNAEFARQSAAARARQRADWFSGCIITRALTLQAQSCGFKGLVRYGRVSSAVLALICAREQAIRDFVPTDYFRPVAGIAAAGGAFKAVWAPSKGHAGVDDEGRLIDPAVGRELQNLVAGKDGVIASVQDQLKSQDAPLPFSLAKLQIHMSKRYGYSLDMTLAAVQELYELGLVSYPRTGSSHLLSGLQDRVAETLPVAAVALGLSQGVLAQVDASRRSGAWNDEKTKGHHAIVPLGGSPGLASMSAVNANVYREICRRYVAQFMPPRTYRSVVVSVDIAAERFQASGTTTQSAGWKALYGESFGDAEDGDAALPNVKQGDPVRCTGLELEAKRTEPPKRFSVSTLAEAMLYVEKHVQDPKIQEIFKRIRLDPRTDDDVGGIGTPATRHTFVPKLESDGMVIVEAPAGKSKEVFYRPSDAAMAMFARLPADLGRPDTTAVWEMVFEKIERGEMTEQQFLQVMSNWVAKTVVAIDNIQLDLPAVEANTKMRSTSRGSAKGSRKPAGSSTYQRTRSA